MKQVHYSIYEMVKILGNENWEYSNMHRNYHKRYKSKIYQINNVLDCILQFFTRIKFHSHSEKGEKQTVKINK